MARKVGPAGHIIALEPQRPVFQMLCANLAINGLENVAAHWAAAGRTAGEIIVPRLDYTLENNFGGIALDQATQNGYPVPVRTIDALTNNGLTLVSCRLIKVDVEGMEAEVLAGAEATIARHRPALYIENDRREKSPALIEAILRQGYRAWWHTPRLFNPDNFRRAEENVFGDIGSVNLFCVHRSAKVNFPVTPREVTGPEDWLG
jgi:FkbM family methyltransferase